jgi:hypothetical protein
MALIVVGTVIGQRIAGPTKSAAHLGLLMLARTGFGKGDFMKLAKRILRAMRDGSLGEGRIVSGAAFKIAAALEPRKAYLIDEVQDQMNMAQNKANPHTSDVWSIWKMYWTAWEQDIPEVTVGRQEKLDVIHPAISLVMTGTPEAFYELVKRSDYSGGLMNRPMVFPVEDDFAKDENPGADEDTLEEPTELVERLQGILPKLNILDGLGPIASAKKDGGGSKLKGANPPPIIHIPWASDGAKLAWEAFRAEMKLEAGSQNFTRRNLWQRCAENAIRVATIVAVGRDGQDAQVTLEDVMLGIALARLSFNTATAQSETFNRTKFSLEEMCEELMAFAEFEGEFDGGRKARGVMTKSQISRKFRGNATRRWNISEGLEHLVDEGRVRRGKMLTPGAARETEIWATWEWEPEGEVTWYKR